MEQKLTFEILDILLKEEGHARRIAKKLNTNHMAIVRKLRDLLNKNVLDFKTEGKNKIYFIKKNIEAKNFIFMTEAYKLNNIIKKHPRLRNIVKEIQENKKIKLAILFGSYAKNTLTKQSDIDIFIETEERELKKKIEALDSKISIKIGKYNKENTLIKEIEKEHVIIKGIEVYYERSRFFS